MIEFFRKTIERARLWQQTTLPVREVAIIDADHNLRQFVVVGKSARINEAVQAVEEREITRSRLRSANRVLQWLLPGSNIHRCIASSADHLKAHENITARRLRDTGALVVRIPFFPRLHR